MADEQRPEKKTDSGQAYVTRRDLEAFELRLDGKFDALHRRIDEMDRRLYYQPNLFPLLLIFHLIMLYRISII